MIDRDPGGRPRVYLNTGRASFAHYDNATTVDRFLVALESLVRS